MAHLELERKISRPKITKQVSRETKTKLDHISVCACTYMRPNLLMNLIEGLLVQKTYNQFKYSIIIVDNDPLGSAREIVESYINNPHSDSAEIEYHHAPTKGITYARNKSLECAKGDYIAFIDDDEVPEPDWLFQLYKALNDFSADAVFGSVIPKFEVSPPQWVLNKKFFYWRDERVGTGKEVRTAVTTNNALIRRNLILLYNLKFDHDFAFAGGEDQAFFFTLSHQKKDTMYISCDKAVVKEHVSSQRCDPQYIRRRHILEGRGRILGICKSANTKSKKVLLLLNRFVQSFSRLLILYLLLFFFYFVDKDAVKKYYYKAFYHLGVLSAILKFSPYKDRKSIGLL